MKFKDNDKPELLAPAGSLEKLKIAVLYGADAVYCGGFSFGLRAGADNFSRQELIQGTKFVHKHGANIYVTVNMIPHNEDLSGLPDFLNFLQEAGVDGLIVSDPGVLRIINREGIEVPIHLSTQANTVNVQSTLFWQEQGLERIILARELSQEEISQIEQKTEIELEIFIHGAMCISYSGRCLLSSYMADRDPNRGECAHCCRWEYRLEEKERPGEYYSIIEEDGYTHILNSRDLNLIRWIPEIVSSGVSSLKIEGRMKGLHYVAVVTGTYRQALDEYFAGPETYDYNSIWGQELEKISHRPYTPGFFPGDIEEKQYPEDSSYLSPYKFLGVVRDFDHKTQEALVEVRNKIFKGDQVEILEPSMKIKNVEVEYIINKEGEKVPDAPHPRELVRIPVEQEIEEFSLLRRKTKEG